MSEKGIEDAQLITDIKIKAFNKEINEWQLSTPVFSVGNQHLYEKFSYVEVLRNEDEIEYIKIIKS